MKKIILSHLIYFATNWLIAQCEDSFTNYEDLPNNITILSGGNCLSDSDIDVLDRIINLNSLNYNSPLELGTQTWLNGRLRFFVAGNYGNSAGINDTIYTLPDNIGDLDNLALLYLEWHRLSELPSSFSQMQSLISVYLNNNILSSLVDDIGNLTNLNLLDLGYNELAIIPNSLCNLQNISYLWLFNNKIEELPDCFCEMNLNWSGDDDSGYPYFAIGANELCNDIPDCISESDNFELSLDQFYYSFPVYSPQICTSVKTTDEDSPLPYKYRVSEPYPNPFNPSVSIDLFIPYERRMKIEVFNNAGNIVNILSNDKVLKSGEHTLSWQGKGYPSGIYFIRVSDMTDQIIKKVMLLK